MSSQTSGPLARAVRVHSRSVLDAVSVIVTNSSRRTSPGLLCSNIRLANDAAVLLILISNVGGEFRAACSNQIEAHSLKLTFDLGHLQRGGKPVGQLGDGFLRRLRW